MRVQVVLRYCAACAIALSLVACASTTKEDPVAATARAKLSAQGLRASTESLVQYAAQGDSTIVEWLLQAGVSAKAVEPRRRVTALHNAAAQGHERIALQLLDAGADVNALDWQGNTPLTLAAFAAQPKLVKLLLSRNADPNVEVAAAGGMPALCAAVYGADAGTVRLLLQAGANPSRTDAFGNTPQALAQRMRREDLVTLLQVRGPTEQAAIKP
jgi:ankyrin repeat protein